jgi:peptide/nickel transport system permease protein
MRRAAAIVLGLLAGAALFAGLLAPEPFDMQFREFPNAAPSRQFLLGTDDLGRDRLSRLLYGARVSMVMAPAAALGATLIAALIGIGAGLAGGWVEATVMLAADLFLSLPWMFLLLSMRAVLPLNTSPIVSLAITFALLSLLGWAGPSRVVRAAVTAVGHSGYVLQARASGIAGLRLVLFYVLPNLKAVMRAQFWISVPVFILAEANLSLLGLGVAEPLPSLGTMLRELENYSAIGARPWMLAPAGFLLAVMICLQAVLPAQEGVR